MKLARAGALRRMERAFGGLPRINRLTFSEASMGIKFRCPNGHKLNVKSFLAGKRGICPHCGAKVRIPEEAEREEAEEERLSQRGSATAVAVAGATSKSLAETTVFSTVIQQPVQAPVSVAETSTPAVASTTSHLAKPLGQVPMGQLPLGQTPLGQVPMGHSPTLHGSQLMGAAPLPGAVPMAGLTAMPGAPQMGVSPYAVMPSVPLDPIAEAPNAVWYVRPPSGGQFGPAKGDIMRKWMGEGRVSADSLVWRDGWADWKSAATVFPALGPAPGAAPTSPGSPAAPIAGVGGSTTTSTPVNRAARVRKKSNSMAIAMVVTLGLVAVVLLGLFIAVLNGLGSG